MRFILALAILLSACANSSPPEPEARPGNPEVYARIETSTDCVELQAEFDRAGDRFDAVEKGTDESGWLLDYMEAADERMAAIDCYE